MTRVGTYIFNAFQGNCRTSPGVSGAHGRRSVCGSAAEELQPSVSATKRRHRRGNWCVSLRRQFPNQCWGTHFIIFVGVGLGLTVERRRRRSRGASAGTGS
ncbi:hypothetical protein BKA81DRAFT_381279 [Phyllosticta paracitricarpa]